MFLLPLNLAYFIPYISPGIGGVTRDIVYIKHLLHAQSLMGTKLASLGLINRSTRVRAVRFLVFCVGDKIIKLWLQCH